MKINYWKLFITFLYFASILSTTLTAQEPVEMIKMRQLHLKIFLNGDSTFKARIYSVPVHYKDTDGSYKEIEPQLVTSTKQGYSYEVSRGIYRVFFKENPIDLNSVLVEHRSGHYLSFRLAGVGYYETSTGNRHLFNNLQSGQCNVDNNQITYQGMLPGLEMRLKYLSNRLKEELIIKQQARSILPDPNQFGFNPDSTYIAFVMEINVDSSLRAFVGDSIEILSGNFQGFDRIAFKDIAKRSCFFLPLDYAYLQQTGVDSSNGTHYIEKLKRRIVTVNGRVYLISGVPYSWLQSIPIGDVIIDPTVYISEDANADTWLENSSPKSGYNILLMAKAQGYPKKRTIIKFDVSEIPEDAVISEAALNMYYYGKHPGYGGSWIDRPIRVYRLTRDWIESQATRDKATSTINWAWQWAEGDYDPTFSDESIVTQTYSWHDWDVTDIVQDWVSGTENDGFLLKATNEDVDGYDIRFRSSEYGVDQYLPYLDVTYQLVMKKRYYIKDHLGSIRSVIDEDGDVVESYDYYPFGLKMPGRVYVEDIPSKNLFTGKERDDETGWDYFGARYYSSAIGRWLSVDPLMEKYPSMTPYNYCANNPLILIDPNGRELYLFGELDASLLDLQDFVGKDDASRLSIGEDNRVIIDTEGYEGGNDNLDFLVELDQATYENGDAVTIGYSASTEDIPAENIAIGAKSGKEVVRGGGIRNASITPRSGEGDMKYPDLPHPNYPPGPAPVHGYDGEVTMSTKVKYEIDGSPIPRSQMQGHELKENLLRTQNKLNYWVAHSIANLKYWGGTKNRNISAILIK